jgi:hypothetical protein
MIASDRTVRLMKLRQPQLMLDHLVPAKREKFRLEEVARILSADDGEAPVTVTSIRNGMEEGHFFGNRIPFGSKLGKVKRIRVEWMTRVDLLHALLSTRTSAAEEQLAQIAEIIERLPAEAQDLLLRHLTTLRAQRPLTRP